MIRIKFIYLLQEFHLKKKKVSLVNEKEEKNCIFSDAEILVNQLILKLAPKLFYLII